MSLSYQSLVRSGLSGGSPVLYAPGEQTSGTAVVDVISGNNGSSNFIPSFGAFTDNYATTIAGVAGKAARYQSAYTQFANLIFNPGSNPFSIRASFVLGSWNSALNEQGFIFGLNEMPGGDMTLDRSKPGATLYFLSNGHLSLNYPNVIDTGFVLSLNTYYNVIATFEVREPGDLQVRQNLWVNVYVNGDAIYSTLFPLSQYAQSIFLANKFTNPNVMIGGGNHNSPSDASINHTVLLNYAATVQDAQNMYAMSTAMGTVPRCAKIGRTITFGVNVIGGGLVGPSPFTLTANGTGATIASQSVQNTQQGTVSISLPAATAGAIAVDQAVTGGRTTASANLFNLTDLAATWTPGTPGSPTFVIAKAPTNDATIGPGGQVVNDAHHAQLQIIPGPTAGTITITGSGGHTATITVLAENALTLNAPGLGLSVPVHAGECVVTAATCDDSGTVIGLTTAPANWMAPSSAPLRLTFANTQAQQIASIVGQDGSPNQFDVAVATVFPNVKSTDTSATTTFVGDRPYYGALAGLYDLIPPVTLAITNQSQLADATRIIDRTKTPPAGTWLASRSQYSPSGDPSGVGLNQVLTQPISIQDGCVDPATGYFYTVASNANSNPIYAPGFSSWKYNPSTQAVEVVSLYQGINLGFTCCVNASWVYNAADPNFGVNHTIWKAAKTAGTSVATASISTGTVISGLAASTTEVYAADSTNNLIKVYDASTLAHLAGRDFALPQKPGKIAYDSNTGLLWVSMNVSPIIGITIPLPTPTISAYNPATGALVHTMPAALTPPFPTALASDPVSGNLMVFDSSLTNHQANYFASDGQTLVKAFGIKGGVFDTTQDKLGKIGPQRFFNPTGGGVDPLTGNIWVASGQHYQGNRIEVYNSAGTRLAYNYAGMNAEDCPILDPYDESTVIGHACTYKIDYTKPSGQEMVMDRINTNPIAHPKDIRLGGSSSAQGFHGVQKVQGRKLIAQMGIYAGNFVAGILREGNASDSCALPLSVLINASFTNGLIGPSGLSNAPAPPWIWTNKHGDSRFSADEFDSVNQSWGDAGGGIRIQPNGDILYGFTRFPFHGFDALGNPIYTTSTVVAGSKVMPFTYLGQAVFGVFNSLYIQDADGFLPGDVYFISADCATGRAGNHSRGIWRVDNWSTTQNVHAGFPLFFPYYWGTGSWGNASEANQLTVIGYLEGRLYLAYFASPEIYVFSALDGTFIESWIPDPTKIVVTTEKDMRDAAVTVVKRPGGDVVVFNAGGDLYRRRWNAPPTYALPAAVGARLLLTLPA